jgi:CheY-like chemotaxis protein
MNGSVGLRLEQYSGSGTAGSEESAHPAASGRGPRRGRILVMDDERMIRETMRRQLAIFGYEVVAVADGREAVAAFRLAREAGQPFDAVILDLVVPTGWGGEQTLSELLKLDPGVKALVCSGSMAGTVRDYERKGFCGVLGKPYAMGELRVMVQAALPPTDRL